MKAKLIKLKGQYHILDDSNIEWLQWYHNNIANRLYRSTNLGILYDGINNRVTHSTQDLEGIIKLNISDIEELVYGYSVDKAIRECDYFFQDPEMFDKYENKDDIKLFKHGFKAHQELTKDKLFTIDEIYRAMDCVYNWMIKGSGNLYGRFPRAETLEELKNNFKEDYLLPKTEWDIEIDDNNKITLI